MIRLTQLALVVLSWSMAGHALAFSDTDKFALSPLEGGGGGRFYTGSPADGYACTVCHRGGTPPQVRITGLPVDGYVPRQTYEVAVTFDQPELSHAISLELLTKAGTSAGTVELFGEEERIPGEFCDQDPTLFPAPFTIDAGGRRIVGLADCHATILRFRFTAPDEPVLAFSMGVVASNGESDSEGDGAAHVSRILRRVGERAPPIIGTTSCSVHPGARGTLAAPWLAAWMWVGVRLRRRRSHARLIAACLALATLTGCARVAPYERETLARRDMELGADADLTAGEEHANAYREGSSGGGSAKGGGCGCN